MTTNTLKNLLVPYGVEPVKFEKLEGYGSLNYRVHTANQKQYVLKIHTDPREMDLIREEHRLLAAMNKDLPFKLPMPVLNVLGQDVTQCPDQSFSRLLTFIHGDLLTTIPFTPGLLQNFGRTIGLLNRAMSGLRSTPYEARKLHWDLQHTLFNRPKAVFIQDPKQRKLVDFFLDQFEHTVLPRYPELRWSMIHGDLNDWNILATPDAVTGIIDFGDMSYSPAIHELAIALNYAMQRSGAHDPIDSVLPMLQGYCSVLGLTRLEIELLYYLIPARLSMSLCHSAEAKNQARDTEYVLISEKPSWTLIENWIQLNPMAVTNRFLGAAGLKSDNPDAHRTEVLEKRRATCGPSLGLSYPEPILMTGSAFQYMYDSQGRTYLDAYNNIPHVGHCHPRVSSAITRQIRRLNTNTRYLSDAMASYNDRLLARFPKPLDTVFYLNSGSAASDLALRMARCVTGRDHTLVLEHGYHGNTLACIEISSYKFDGKGGSGPCSRVTRLPLPRAFMGDFTTGEDYAHDAIARISGLLSQGTLPSAFIAEPVSGCGGQVPLAPGYMQHLGPWLNARGILTIIDEVQTGFGRLGTHFWGFEQLGIVPDLVVLGKPMGNGHPIAAVVTRREIAMAFANGMEFFSSFGGNPVSLEAASAVLDVMDDEGLMEHARITGHHLTSTLNRIARTHKVMGDVRGSGLFLGIDFITRDSKPATALAGRVKDALKLRGILTGTDGPHDNVLKIKPPMCFNQRDADLFCHHLDLVLTHENQTEPV
ncbi:MAG: aminotransferase class III-fold pyridoxal phosphate-dependent enzyme [Pseudomonadota bacterium]